MNLNDVTAAARQLVPVIAERAVKTEEERRLLPESLNDMRDAGMFKLVQPKRWGGFELEPAALVSASTEIAKACASTGWCLGVLAVHSWMLGLYDERAQVDVWGDDPETLLSASFAATGQVERVGDEIRVSGRWSFASGCDVASWMMVGGILPSDGPIPDIRMFLIPKRDYRIEDNWYASGLVGTGSKDIVIDGATVPEYRSLSLIEAGQGLSPGRTLYPDSPLYRVPFGTMLLLALAGPGLGAARGAYSAFVARARDRIMTYSGEKASEQTPIHLLLGEVSYELDAVALLWERDLDEIALRTRDRSDFTMKERARYKRDIGQGLLKCREAAAALSAASGGHGILRSSPLQRAFRDTHAITTHAALDPVQATRSMGRVELGLDPATAMI